MKAVLSEVDYVESADASETEINDAIAHAVAGVDLLAFAQNTLDATASVWWVDPSTGARQTLAGAQKDAIVDESLAAWLKREQSIGETSTLGDLLGVKLYPPTSVDRNRGDSQLEVIGQGLQPLTLMFGAHDSDDDWSWHVEQAAVTGPNTADVTYSAETSASALWRFANPSRTYTKRLIFAPTAGGGWRLSGWSNYPEVRTRLLGNITPPDGDTAVDEWWSSL